MGGGGRAEAREAGPRVLIFLKKDSEQPEEEYPRHGKEISKFTSGAAACRQWPEGELYRDVMPGSCGYPLGISSNDGWKDENICGLTRLESVSTSSINQGSPKSSRRKASCTHGLRMQLRLLKMEATDDAHDTDLVLFSNDETAELTNPR
ncbi:hypothetical protein D1007_54440 [Hordeum vulgare]|nr:hypothetical protein D1007_54440 [Hordeum vulgare]